MAVLLSIKPQYCELIASGKKTIELRKSLPKDLLPPFKCYIYECNWKNNSFYAYKHKGKLGKVIGEYICNSINEYDMFPDEYGTYDIFDDDVDRICLGTDKIWDYGKGVRLYGYIISELKIYDEPKELKDFGLTRPPQSWCYVKELE